MVLNLLYVFVAGVWLARKGRRGRGERQGAVARRGEGGREENRRGVLTRREKIGGGTDHCFAWRRFDKITARMIY